MLYGEWNLETALKVRGEEGREEGLAEGLEIGREEGLEKGQEKKALEIAQKLLATGTAPEFVQEITGLDRETIEKLQMRN